MDFDPKLMMMVCFFLGCKVENIHLSLEDLARRVPSIEKEVPRLTQLELVLAKTLKFEFFLRHPYTALYGIFLDAQVISSREIYV